MSEIIGNRYQVTKLIGKGGMADVYLAWDTILNREVAIKVLKSDMSDDEVALERFKREAGATTKLSHPNIVDVYDVGDDYDKHYIVMEYVKGYTLKQLIKKRGAIPYKEAVWMCKQIAGALMEAHRKGIIHRDVKSQNVLIKPDGTIKLSDFGIALANGSMQITHKDSVLGSVHYLAPELSRGKQASMQSDIYSLGIVLFELLTGDVPFKADTPVQVALMHVKNNIPSVKKYNNDIPQSVENIIIRATAKSLSNRYKNIAIMLQDLNNCLKPEHLNDSKIDFETINLNKNKNIQIASEYDKNEKTKKKLSTAFIITACLISILLLVSIFALTGILGKKNEKVVVPPIINLTVIEANDLLSENGLFIDEGRITYDLSDSIEKDKIISVYPDVGQEVNANTKIKIVVSKGIASKYDDYVGRNCEDVKNELRNLNINFKTIPVESDKKSGTVISQDPKAGEKYDPNVNNFITIEYASNNADIILDTSYKNKDLEDIIKFFEENNIDNEHFKLIAKDKDFFTEEELKDSKINTVIRTNPELGTSYSTNSDIIIEVYYYTEEINEEVNEQ